jgi:hypothetical protein
MFIQQGRTSWFFVAILSLIAAVVAGVLMVYVSRRVGPFQKPSYGEVLTQLSGGQFLTHKLQWQKRRGTNLGDYAEDRLLHLLFRNSK